MKKLTQMFVVFVLTACFTLGAASVKITKVDTRTNLATPENTGPSLAPSSGRKATTWSAFILSYEIGGEKFSDVDVTWEGIQKNGTKVFTYKKKVSYLDVPAGVNYASIFISPTYIEKEFNGKALDFMKNIIFKVFAKNQNGFLQSLLDYFH